MAMRDIQHVTESLPWERHSPETEAHLRAALDAAPLPTVLLTPDGQPLFRNRAYAELLGYDTAGFLEIPFGRLTTPESDSIADIAWEAALEGTKPSPVALQLMHKDGHSIDVELRVASVEIDERVIGSVATFRDVTVEQAAFRELQESRRQHRKAQGLAHLGHWDWDLVADEGAWSDEVYRIYGLEPQEVSPTGSAFLQIVHPEDRAAIKDDIQVAIEQGGRYERTHRIVRPDGTIRVVLRVGEVACAEDGTAVRVDGTVLDITEMTAVQAELLERRVFLKTTLDAIRSGVIVATREGVITEASARALELLGYSGGELAGLRFSDLVAEEDRGWLRERSEARRRGEQGPPSTIVRARRKDGSWFDLDGRGTPHIIAGVVEGVVIDFRDVTAERELQKLADQRLEQINAILEATPDAVVVADAAGLILEANVAAGVTFGYEPEDLAGQPLSILVPGLYTAGRSSALRAHQRNRESPDLAEPAAEGFVEAAGHHKDGSRFPVEYAVAETSLDDGRWLLVAAIRDIRAQKATEQELLRLNREVDRRARDRQSLVEQILTAQEEERRSVAYDIHDGPAQQLAAVQMFLETYVHEFQIDLADPLFEHLSRAKSNLDAGLTDIRRIMSGLRPSLLDDVGLSESLHQLLIELAKPTGSQIEFRADSLVDQLAADVEITLYRVTQEAVGNALKHSGTDRVSVEVWSDGESVSLRVQDWGAGFDPSAVPKPDFGRYFGLVGMRERVELLSGQLEIVSDPGEGARITIQIPLRASASEMERVGRPV